MVSLLIAAQDLEAGTVIELDHLAMIELPQAILPTTTIQPEDAVGQVLLEPMQANDLILSVRLGEPGPDPWSPWVPAGHTTLRVPFPSLRSLPRPGQVVDVVIPRPSPCLWLHAAPVVAAEGSDGNVVVAWHSPGRFAAVRIVQPDDQILPASPDAIELWLRHPGDDAEHPLPDCGQP